MSDIILSIIIPCYNTGIFVENALGMFVKQGLDDIEVLVVDDGSSDNTKEIVEEWVKKYPRISLISFEKNKGVSVARNTGIEMAKGRYIQFFDSDDSMPDGTLDFYRKFLLDKNNDILVFGHEMRHNKRIKIIRNKKYNDNKFTSLEFLKLFFVRKIKCHLCSQIYSRKFLIENSLLFIEGMTKGQDIIFYRSAYFYTNNIYCNSHIVFIYKIRQGSVSEEYIIYPKKELESFECDVNIIEKLSKKIPAIIKYANFFLAERYVGNLIKFIRFADKDKIEIANRLFYRKYLLYNKFIFSFPKSIIFWGLRFIPIKWILKIIR